MEFMNVDEVVRGDRRRADALAIARASIEAVLPENIICNSVRLEGDLLFIRGQKYDLAKYGHVYVAGGGKASAAMAVELEKVLGHRITAGIVNDRYGVDVMTSTIKVNHAGHPLPTEDGVRGVHAMVEMLSAAGPDDLVIFLISGGGSALLPSPADYIRLQDCIRLTDMLLKSGARIAEMNAVRKHVSAIKGGQFLHYVGGATVIGLIVSDVVGDDVGFISSGPTAPDTTTYADAIGILRKYDILKRAPLRIVGHLEAGLNGDVPETPKPGDPLFDRVRNFVVASGIIALRAAAVKAQQLGYRPLILGSGIVGESRDAGLVISGIARECLRSGNPVGPPAALISGGETTVTIKGMGRGGRNQEFVLGFLQDMAPGITLVSMDTDGIDGVTDACGAIADGMTLERAQKAGLSIGDALKENASYDFFNALGDLLFSGPTGTNVSDLHVILAYED